MFVELVMLYLMMVEFYIDKFVGVGLDLDEKNNLLEKFSVVFVKVRDMGLKFIMYCDVN